MGRGLQDMGAERMDVGCGMDGREPCYFRIGMCECPLLTPGRWCFPVVNVVEFRCVVSGQPVLWLGSTSGWAKPPAFEAYRFSPLKFRLLRGNNLSIPSVLVSNLPTITSILLKSLQFHSVAHNSSYYLYKQALLLSSFFVSSYPVSIIT